MGNCSTIKYTANELLLSVDITSDIEKIKNILYQIYEFYDFLTTANKKKFDVLNRFVLTKGSGDALPKG